MQLYTSLDHRRLRRSNSTCLSCFRRSVQGRSGFCGQLLEIRRESVALSTYDFFKWESPNRSVWRIFNFPSYITKRVAITAKAEDIYVNFFSGMKHQRADFSWWSLKQQSILPVLNLLESTKRLDQISTNKTQMVVVFSNKKSSTNI